MITITMHYPHLLKTSIKIAKFWDSTGHHTSWIKDLMDCYSSSSSSNHSNPSNDPHNNNIAFSLNDNDDKKQIFSIRKEEEEEDVADFLKDTAKKSNPNLILNLNDDIFIKNIVSDLNSELQMIFISNNNIIYFTGIFFHCSK